MVVCGTDEYLGHNSVPGVLYVSVTAGLSGPPSKNNHPWSKIMTRGQKLTADEGLKDR